MTTFRVELNLPPRTAWRALHLSDLHLGKERDPAPHDVFRAWLDDVVPFCELDHLVISGDLVHVPEDRERLVWIRAALEALDVPWSVLPGNHDVRHPDVPGVFEEVFGNFPRVVASGPVDLILFDSFGGLSFEDRPEDEQARLQESGHLAHGAVSEAQWDTIRPHLREDAERLVVVHHHLHEDPLDDENLRSMRPLYDADSFIERARGIGAHAILHGHKHAPAEPEFEDGVWVIRGGASTKAPFRARLIDVDPTGVRWSSIELLPG